MTTSPIVVRDARTEDAAALAPLLEALGYPAEVETIVERLRDLRTTDATARVLVATDGDRVVGFATLHRTAVLHRAAAVGRVTAIAVLPSVQGRGVGRALMGAAEDHFRSLNVERLEVTSGPGRSAAYPFYRRLGYLDRGIRFVKNMGVGG